PRPSDRSPRRSALPLGDQGSHVLPPRYIGRRGLAPAPAPRVYPGPSERLEPRSRRPCSLIPSVTSPSRISTKRSAAKACLDGTTENPPLRVMPRRMRPGKLQASASLCRRTPEEVPVRVNLIDPDRADPVRVLVVDDHQAFRHALSSALDMVDGIEVAVAVAERGPPSMRPISPKYPP